jgi:RNA polymerase sigma factor (sigma-70 family)
MTKHDRQDSSVRGKGKSLGKGQRPPEKVAGYHRITPSSSETAVQEIFLRLRRYDSAELVENPQACLFKVAAGVTEEGAFRYLNAERLEMARLADGPNDRPPHVRMSWLDDQDEIEQALLALRGQEREVLKLQFIEGLSHAQITKRLGVTEWVVRRVLAKGYRQLTGKLAPRRAG